MTETEHKKHYEGLNGLRTISCIAIIIMHICANVDYTISGFFYTHVIDSWKWLVYLFMIISSFGLCCGYLERFRSGSIDLGHFYKRRYAKILPFFGLLIAMELVLEPSPDSFSEAFLELTLMHGLLPNNAPNVIGVGWFLGTVFLFYMLFPFFTVLIRTKRRALLTLLVAIGINIVCTCYYYRSENVMPRFVASHNFLYCSPFFALGGVLYHYKDTVTAKIQNIRIPMLIICVILTIAYYMTPDSVSGLSIVPYKAIILFAFWIAYTISFDSKILNNRITKFVSTISLELYLAQMIVFRVLEKLRLLHLFKNEWLSLLVAILMEMLLLIGFVYVCRYLILLIQKILTRRNKVI